MVVLVKGTYWIILRRHDAGRVQWLVIGLPITVEISQALEQPSLHSIPLPPRL